MARSTELIVDADGRDLRVSNPERVIFPRTNHSGPLTKLDIVNYYLAVDDGIMRALNRRPTTLERWPKGVHPGIVLSTREKGGGDAFYQLGYTGFPKTSGGRGVHLYIRIEPRWTFTDVRHAAIAFGRELERRLPGRVTTKWWKEERGQRIFVDYNQNARDRTIASAYSVRPKPGAPVSAPVAWDELPKVAPEDFTVATMPARFAQLGDLHAAIDERAHSLQPLLDMYERDAAIGEEDMPYPPDYPKMPGEPKRVQPSRDRDRHRA